MNFKNKNELRDHWLPILNSMKWRHSDNCVPNDRIDISISPYRIRLGLYSEDLKQHGDLFIRSDIPSSRILPIQYKNFIIDVIDSLSDDMKTSSLPYPFFNS